MHLPITGRHIAIATASVAFVGVLSVVSATSSQSVATVPTGRLLASNCFQCHGTDGQSGAIDQLAGDGAADMFKKLKDQQKKSSIMGVHARGYSDAQLKAIAAYFASVKKI